MAGHNKWSKIKRKKAVKDQRMNKIYSRLIREITIAAREGGGDPDANPRLRTAVANAKSNNMPNDVIERAIQRGTGEIEGAAYEECVYEGYGPGGVAFYIEVTTDNRNRTAAEVRHVLTKHGGSLSEPNSVAWLFQKRGSILVRKENTDEEALMLAALEAGAEDITDDDDETYEVVTTPEAFEAVRSELEAQGFPIESAEIELVPQTTVSVEGKDAERILNLYEALDDLDDVSNVAANFDVADEVMASLTAA